MIRKQVYTLVLLFTGITAPLRAGEFYNATQPRTYPGDAMSYYYNPGPTNGGEAGHILFDDVTVQTPWANPLFDVTKVTVKVTRKSSAPAVTISPYESQLYDDPLINLPPRGGIGDGTADDPQSPLPFSTPRVLPINTAGATVEQEISFGDGTHTLFAVPGHAASTDTRYRSFAVGLNFSTVGYETGWTIAQLSQNLDLLWDFKDNTHFSEFTYAFDDDNGMIRGTQFMKVEGYVLSGVPGDATIDGKVDISDLLRLATHWGQSGDYTQGDFNFDGVVNSADLTILAAHWQSTTASLADSLASLGLPESAVPEPSVLAITVGFLGILVRRR